MAILGALFSVVPLACDRAKPEQHPSRVAAQTDSASRQASVDNLTCPVHPDEAIPDQPDPDRIVEHRGHRIGLCSAACAKDWAHWSDARRATYLDLIAGADPR